MDFGESDFCQCNWGHNTPLSGMYSYDCPHEQTCTTKKKIYIYFLPGTGDKIECSSSRIWHPIPCLLPLDWLLNKRFFDLGTSPLPNDSPLSRADLYGCPRKPPYTYAHTHTHTHTHTYQVRFLGVYISVVRYVWVVGPPQYIVIVVYSKWMALCETKLHYIFQCVYQCVTIITLWYTISNAKKLWRSVFF